MERMIQSVLEYLNKLSGYKGTRRIGPPPNDGNTEFFIVISTAGTISGTDASGNVFTGVNMPVGQTSCLFKSVTFGTAVGFATY